MGTTTAVICYDFTKTGKKQQQTNKSNSFKLGQNHSSIVYTQYFFLKKKQNKRTVQYFFGNDLIWFA